MKDMFESSETFTAYATIDAGYYMMEELYKEMDKPLSAIEAMIDEQTGYGKAKIIEWNKSAISIMEDVIKAKKFIEADYSANEKILIELKEKLKIINNHE